VVGFNEHGNVLHFVGGEGFFLDHLSHCHLFKKDPAQWSF